MMEQNYLNYLRFDNIQLSEAEVKTLYDKHINECKVEGLKDEYRDEYLYLSAIHTKYLEMMKGKKPNKLPFIVIIDGAPRERSTSLY